MSSSSAFRAWLAGVLALATSAGALADDRAYLLGGGVDLDTADGLAVSALANFEIGEKTANQTAFLRQFNKELAKLKSSQTFQALLDQAIGKQFKF